MFPLLLLGLSDFNNHWFECVLRIDYIQFVRASFGHVDLEGACIVNESCVLSPIQHYSSARVVQVACSLIYINIDYLYPLTIDDSLDEMGLGIGGC